MDSAIPETEVLIVGAGPTGLVLGLWLTRLGVRVRIIDKTAEAGTTSRALAVQSRTLEFYNQIGLADEIVAHGHKVAAANFWVAGRKTARFELTDAGEGLSPYSQPLIFPQDEHERALIECLAHSGIKVERQTELVSFDDRDERVTARIKLADGTEQTCRAAYIAGCDGARSVVRQNLRIGFPGGVYSHLFYVADVEARGAAMDGDIHVGLDVADFLAVFPLKGQGRARLVGTVREEAEHQHENLSWNDVSRRVVEWMRIEVAKVNWFSTYRVHHRVADHFGRGRAFLLGDAGHIHSPVGGQGMNTGIGDAVNLAWKLAAAIHGHANRSLLETYEPERIAFARRLVASTDRAFTQVTSSGAIARVARLDIVPLVFPWIFKLASVRRFMFRAVSQIDINYRSGQLSEGRAGSVHGGDRLPWVTTDSAGHDNFAPLRSLSWQVHVYGDAAPQLRTLCEQRRLPLHVFSWSSAAARAGLARNAAYLVRPDGYVALADPAADASKVTSYFNIRSLNPVTTASRDAGQFPPIGAVSA